MQFHEKLMLLRKQRGYTQEALAEKLGVSRQAVSRWESGETTPELALLKRICAVFGVSADYLLNDEVGSEDDLPIIKAKNEEIRTVKRERKRWLPVSAVAYAFAACCFQVSAVSADHPLAAVLFFGSEILLVGISLLMLARYFKS